MSGEGKSKKATKKIDKEKKERTRRKKDPNAPKRARSAYIIYCTKHRAAMKEENPDAKPSEIMAKLGEQWKTLSDDEKVPYQGEASTDKERYATEMKTYVPSEESPVKETKSKKGKKNGKEKKSRVSKKRSKKDPDAPKRPMSAYIIFTNAKREQTKKNNPNAKASDLMRLLGEQWKQLTPEEQQPYKDQASEHKKKYTEEKEAYDRNKPAEPEEEEEEEEEAANDDDGEEEAEPANDDDDDEEEEEDDDDDDE